MKPLTARQEEALDLLAWADRQVPRCLATRRTFWRHAGSVPALSVFDALVAKGLAECPFRGAGQDGAIYRLTAAGHDRARPAPAAHPADAVTPKEPRP